MIKSALILILPLIVSMAYSQEIGTIEIEIKNWEGDLIDPYGTKLIVYQNNESIQEIELESNPQKISNLPIGSSYSFDVIRHGIVIPANKYVDLYSSSESVRISIPSDGGMKFNIFYNDGYTPVNGASVTIKSMEGIPLVTANTNSQGQIERFWFQSTVDDQFYFAEVTLDDGLSFIYSPVKTSSGSASDYKVITPWPSIIDELISVEVIQNGKKISKNDGAFKVELYDKNNQKISESPVKRGEAHFSNFPVGKYVFQVLKKTDDTYEIWNTFEVILDGKHNTVQISESLLGSDKGCNCVAFRLDDVQDYFLSETQKAVIELFAEKGAPLTIGVIGGLIGEDEALVNTIKNHLQNEDVSLEIASHSWNNVPVTSYSKAEQDSILKMTNKQISENFGIMPTVFIPPENVFNEETIEVLQENGFTHMSSSYVNDLPPYPFQDSKFYRFPQGAQTAQLDVNTNQWIIEDRNKIFEDIESSMNNYGYAVVMMHPPDFSLNDLGVYRNQVDQKNLDELSILIDEIKNSGFEIVPISQINHDSKPIETKILDDNNCNCVAFTIEGIQDYWLNEVQLEIFETFDNENIKFSTGIIANQFGEDQKLVNYFKTKLYTSNKIDIANNGLNYENMVELTLEVQSSFISDANNKIQNVLGVKPIIFIPPQDGINESVIEALKQNSMKVVSSSVSTSPPPYTFDDSIHKIPYGVTTSVYDLEQQKFNGLSSDESFSQIVENVNQNGFAVVRSNIQEFAEEQKGELQNKVNSQRIVELISLIQKTKQGGYNIVPITEIPKLSSSEIVYVPNWIKNNAGWWAQDQITDEDFVTGIEFMIQNDIIKIPISSSGESKESQIPSWIKNNAGWWAQDSISDSEFVAGIEFLVKMGIIQI